MNNDGWGQVGAGMSDDRIAGEDLQHYRQTRTSDEGRNPVRRVVRDSRESGGPMKHQELKSRLDESLGMRHGAESEHSESMASRRHESEGMTHHYAPILDEESMRHQNAMQHHMNHLQKHYGRAYDSQHGHDNYTY